MTVLVQEFLKTFDRLTNSERLDLASEILRRTVHLDFPPLPDQDLALNAEAVFLALDEQEAVNECS
ncbi:MAG: hypothetical protein MH252_01065 [Thermosynechococcaceae cyanobacterium MS004]|nr:hypothetical protein [Thermosynechococcaceae cyanobacterium MS004]